MDNNVGIVDEGKTNKQRVKGKVLRENMDNLEKVNKEFKKV